VGDGRLRGALIYVNLIFVNCIIGVAGDVRESSLANVHGPRSTGSLQCVRGEHREKQTSMRTLQAFALREGITVGLTSFVDYVH